MRKPRRVRVAAVQNSIALSPSEPVHSQISAIHCKIAKFIEAAAASDVNILCLQELWSKKFIKHMNCVIITIFFF